MKFGLTPLAVATCVAALTPLGGVAFAQAAKSPAAPVVRHAAAKPAIPTKAPEDWIIYDDATYSPVVDDVSRHLDAARKAFKAKDNKKSAQEMRAVADELTRQAARAEKENAALLQTDKAVLTADTTAAQENATRMKAGAVTIDSAAAAIESGKIKTEADLDKAIDRAARDDMDRRWMVADVTTWYPVIEEPQRHFTNAVAAYARKDYKAAATDIRMATSYVRLEARRATGETKRELDRSVGRLDALAGSVERGTLKEEQSMAKVFANANHALAVEHRAKAGEFWARKDYDKAGYELKAASFGLESAAGWAGGEAKAAASATVADTRAIGDKLASGSAWTRQEITKGMQALGDGIEALGQKINYMTSPE